MQTESQLILNLILVFTFVLLLITFFFFVLIYRYNKNLKIKHYESLNNFLVGQLNERERIARDLHDSLNPQLSAINLKLDTIKCDDLEFSATKSKIRNEINQSVIRIRQISHDLMPTNLKLNTLHWVIKDYVVNTQNPNLQISFFSNAENLNFKEIEKFHLFYILLELVQNTIKHSNANKITIHLNYDKNKHILKFNYEDNGIEILENIFEKEGIGIKNIISRLNILNADFSFDTESGFKLNVILKKTIINE